MVVNKNLDDLEHPKRIDKIEITEYKYKISLKVIIIRQTSTIYY
jgi:hypothetical protein